MRNLVAGPHATNEDENTHSVTTQYRVACRCGANAGEILGFSLGSLNPEYQGAWQMCWLRVSLHDCGVRALA
jgi:hypothetical protein